MDLLKYASQFGDVLRPFGDFETLLYYGVVAKKLTKFLKGKEIAAKNWLPESPRMPYLIKRGSKLKPLHIGDFADAITPEFLETRRDIRTLADAKKKLTATQQLAWDYFLPRKLSDLFYATNGESQGGGIERIFYDIDVGDGATAEDALVVVRKFVDILSSDDALGKLGCSAPFVMWTGASFHVYIFLGKPRPNPFYVKYFQYSKDGTGTLTEKWVEELKKTVRVKVAGGHDKLARTITIDPSQTPSGKLCRAPFSLHMADARRVDGVSVPLALDMLGDAGLVGKLRDYTPAKVLDGLDGLAKRFPRKFR